MKDLTVYMGHLPKIVSYPWESNTPSAPHEMLLSPPDQHTTSAPSIHVSPPHQDPNRFVAIPTQTIRPQFNSAHPNNQFDQQNSKIILLLGTSIVNNQMS